MSFHSVKAQCRICKNDIVVKISDDYPWPIDDLLKIATCNRCYDMRERRDRAIEAVKNTCEWLVQRPKPTADELKTARSSLEKATKAYAMITAEYYGSKVLVWSEQFAKNLMDNPDKWYEQLKFYRSAIREQIKLS